MARPVGSCLAVICLVGHGCFGCRSAVVAFVKFEPQLDRSASVALVECEQQLDKSAVVAFVEHELQLDRSAIVAFVELRAAS